MNAMLIFGISALLTFVSGCAAAMFFAWPWLRTKARSQALAWLVTPHMFLRFIGLSFLVPGVVSPSLPAGWAVPVAYGDLVAGILAIVASIGLAKRSSWSIPAVWLFNIWGFADLAFGGYEGPRNHLQPGALGAGYYLITGIVPLLMMSHLLIFGLLAGKGEIAIAERIRG
jgi:hypothetical protein